MKAHATGGNTVATIRKRAWQSGGETKTAWVADYFDQNGKRRLKTFKTRKEADFWLVQARGEVQRGTHTPDSASITVSRAADLWLERCERDDLEQSTMQGYRSHVRYHIKPLTGSEKLSKLSAPRVEAFKNQLLRTDRSRALTKKIISSLSSIVSEAQRRGLTAHNAVRDVRVRLPKRENGRPEMPTHDELRSMLEAASGRWRPLIVTLIFTGLRGSEARGLKWSDVDLDKRVLRVRRRVDQWGVFGPPKSAAGTREIPLAPHVVNTLKEWKLAYPRPIIGRDEKGKPIREEHRGTHLVFPNGAGNVESHANILSRGFHPLQVACGIVTPKLDDQGEPVVDKKGEPVMEAKYGLHALRHAAAALFIEHGTSPKRVQAIMGHDSIQMTFDLYGYLFDLHDDDRDAMASFGARLVSA